MPGQDLIEGGAQADQPTAQGGSLELEGAQKIVGSTVTAHGQADMQKLTRCKGCGLLQAPRQDAFLSVQAVFGLDRRPPTAVRRSPLR